MSSALRTFATAVLFGMISAVETAAAGSLPTLALDPQVSPPSAWAGLHVGTEVFGVSGRGGARGGFGGSVFVGYDRAFANNILLSIEGSSGTVPLAFGRGRVRGFDDAAADLTLGYDMGRVVPFVTTGVVLARPRLGPGLPASWGTESFNTLINGPDVEAVGRVGAGVAIAVTDNVHLGLGVSVSNGRGPLAP